MDNRDGVSASRDTASSILAHIDKQKGFISQGYHDMKCELESMRTLTKRNTDILFDTCVKSVDEMLAVEMERLNSYDNTDQLHDAERSFSELRHRHQQLSNLLQEQLYNLTPYGKGVSLAGTSNDEDEQSIAMTLLVNSSTPSSLPPPAEQQRVTFEATEKENVLDCGSDSSDTMEYKAH